jgi:hypothetical protein
MMFTNRLSLALLVTAMLATGCSNPADKTAGEKDGKDSKGGATAGVTTGGHAHGTGPNGGVVFDLGSFHAEFNVDHDKQSCDVVFLGGDGKTPVPVAASELVLSTKETKTKDGKVVAPMTVVLQPADAAGGMASKFVGTDPGIANVADFAGTITGEIDGKPAAGEFDEAAGGGHGHAHTPHDGVVAVLNAEPGGNVGFVELKLHDDKGDLELWLAKDRAITQPLDIPAGTTIQISFKVVPGKSATLAVRNSQQNEDEDGKANMRGEMTNYFIFPGESGQDPKWLMGKSFRSAVTVTFSVDGRNYRSEEFVLVPHTHADGEDHP